MMLYRYFISDLQCFTLFLLLFIMYSMPVSIRLYHFSYDANFVQMTLIFPGMQFLDILCKS